MRDEIKVPTLGESVTEAIVAKWHKAPGDAVGVDELLCELETDKVTVEVPAQKAGVLLEVLAAEGETVAIGAILGVVDSDAKAAAKADAPAPAPEKPPAPPPEAAPKSDGAPILSPAAQRLAKESDVKAEAIHGTGKDGRITKADVQTALEKGCLLYTSDAADE